MTYEICIKVFRLGLAIHFKFSRQRVNMYSCNTCGRDLKSKQNLIYHMKKCKTPCKRSTMLCPEYNKGFVNVKTLRQHQCSGSGLPRVAVADTQPAESQSDDS